MLQQAEPGPGHTGSYIGTEQRNPNRRRGAEPETGPRGPRGPLSSTLPGPAPRALSAPGLLALPVTVPGGAGRSLTRRDPGRTTGGCSDATDVCPDDRRENTRTRPMQRKRSSRSIGGSASTERTCQSYSDANDGGHDDLLLQHRPMARCTKWVENKLASLRAPRGTSEHRRIQAVHAHGNTQVPRPPALLPKTNDLRVVTTLCIRDSACGLQGVLAFDLQAICLH